MAQKSNTKYFKFRGLTSYPKVYEPDDFLDKKQWKVSLHPDVDTIAKIKATGIQLKLRDPNEDKSGVAGKFFTFTRDVKRDYNGKTTYFLPPTVYDKNGEILVSYSFNDEGKIIQKGDPVVIGNGSLIEVEVAVYPLQKIKGFGQRFHSIRIIDLVEYERPEEVYYHEVDNEVNNEAETEVHDEGVQEDFQEEATGSAATTLFDPSEVRAHKKASDTEKTTKKVPW